MTISAQNSSDPQVRLAGLAHAAYGTDGFDLTLLAVAALPLFTFPAKRVARILRRVTDQQMERNAAMSAILQETFNISGALLVKLFGRARTESDRYGVEAAAARDLGDQHRVFHAVPHESRVHAH